MKRKLLLGLIGNVLCLSAMGQTITAPTGQPLNITNNVEVVGNLNIPSDSAFKIGGFKVFRSTNGGDNLFIGRLSGNANTSGTYNAFLGYGAGRLNTTGFQNLFMGSGSGYNNNTGNYNSFIGVNAGFANVSGSNNLFLGSNSGFANTTGEYNTFIGNSSGYANTSGVQNLFLGAGAGYANQDGGFNSFVGVNSGFNNTSGSNNLFIGKDAGSANTSGSSNTYLGVGSGGSATITNATAIGAGATTSVSSTVVLGQAATTITGQGLAAGASGLRFANLNASSAAVASGGSNKVLSVDGSGNVVLVALAGGVTTTATNPVAESTWKNADGYLYNNSTNGVVINGAGLDGNALIVKGGVLSKEVNVKVEGAESWPDYVFKPSYKRMSLEEVEKFISINGHLPNVASATEMAATGNNLNKTDIKLLEKVEELTLYLLDMKKANDAQSAEIQSLKNQMNKLKKNRK